jgi:hypothetical protein
MDQCCDHNFLASVTIFRLKSAIFSNSSVMIIFGNNYIAAFLIKTALFLPICLC